MKALTRTLLIKCFFLAPAAVLGQSRDMDLNVAVFAYLPDASTAIERLEEAFEQRYAAIDLDLELWNPYDDALEDDGLAQIVDFDIVEIDTCRIDELMNGSFGGLDPIPAEIRRSPDAYWGPARAIVRTEIGAYVVPHWVCGNYLQIWSTNTDVVNASSFEAFLKAVDPAAHRPVLAAMWGSTGLGEFYADAVLDIDGPEKAKAHLIALSTRSAKLDERAKNAVLALIQELSPENQRHLEHYDNHSYYLARQFAQCKSAVLIGYSERLYYSERELQLTPGQDPPVVRPEDMVIRPFAFGLKSQGTPAWTDGFVIPKGRLAGKQAAIVAFLQFIQSNDAYEVFARPAPYLAPTYLLPATEAAYDEDSPLLSSQPLLPKFRDAMSEAFPVSNSQLWQGMRAAGARLRDILRPRQTSQGRDLTMQ